MANTAKPVPAAVEAGTDKCPECGGTSGNVSWHRPSCPRSFIRTVTVGVPAPVPVGVTRMVADAIAEVNALINDSDGLRGLNATDTDSWEELRAEGHLRAFDRVLDALHRIESAHPAPPSDGTAAGRTEGNWRHDPLIRAAWPTFDKDIGGTRYGLISKRDLEMICDRVAALSLSLPPTEEPKNG